MLVHSPLVGPGSWSPVARELRRRGRSVLVPSFVGPEREPPRDLQHCVCVVEAAIRELPRSVDVLLVGHSGGGLLLPWIADAVAPRTVTRLICVDSEIPPSGGEAPFAPAWFLDQLSPLVTDGVLPPWSTWFGEEVMRDLVPDDYLRATLEQEMPSLPLAFLNQTVPIPAGWDRLPCGYLLLSEAYTDAAEEATARGWHVEKIHDAHHLHIAVAPDTVTEALLRLASA